jgi:hypothetical protein
MADAVVGAFEYNLDCLPGYVSGADLSAKQYHFMKTNGSGQAVSCDTLGEKALGVLCNAPSAIGRPTSIAYGTSLVQCVASAAIAAGANVATTATGRAVTAATGNQILGKAVTPAAANGQIFTVQLTQGGAVQA